VRVDNILRTRHAQVLTQPLSPHATDVFEAFYHTCTCYFRFTFLEFPVPVAPFDVCPAFFGLLVLALPLVQLLFARP
jgi:hypothetical protein